MSDPDELVALLLEENQQLRERVQAVEASRWWRLNPRSRLERFMAARRRFSPRKPAVAHAPRAQDADDDEWVRFRREVYERGAFTKDWFRHNLLAWRPLMEELSGRSARILEIGSFEGLSACYVLWRLRDAHVTCIDTFKGSPENVADVDLSAASLEAAFDANVALVDGSRVRKLVGDSKHVLTELLDEGAPFDLAYVDGSHLALDVLVDAALCWRILAPGGVLVFDDYEWSVLGDDRLLSPAAAADAFLTVVDGRYELVSSGRQLIVRKTAFVGTS